MADIIKARLHEIKLRYRRRRRGRKFSLAAVRRSELDALFTDRYGHELPDDDAGRDDVAIMAHHMADGESGDPSDSIREWVHNRAPWMTFRELDVLIEGVLTHPRRWKADNLAWRLRLTEADRTRLGITTIGAIDFGQAARQARRRHRDRIRKEIKRRIRGSRPRSQYEGQSINRAKPWIAAGMSRASWYRKRDRET